MQDDLPSLPSPAVLAQLTEVYEKAEFSTSCKWGKKLQKVKEENIEYALTGGLVGAILSLMVLVPIFAILR